MLLLVLLVMFAILFGGGVLLGYFIGRRAGRKESQQGFAVLPANQVSAARPDSVATRSH